MDGSLQRKRNYVQRKRDAVLKLLGGKCLWKDCTWDDPRVLQVDHINGGGSEEIRRLGNVGVYNKILNMEHPEVEYQLLCANHNQIKRVENKETSRRYASN